jgi:hypothetical protein
MVEFNIYVMFKLCKLFFIQVAFCFSTMNTTNIYCLFYFILCTDLYGSLCQSVTLFLFMYMQFFIVSLHWKYYVFNRRSTLNDRSAVALVTGVVKFLATHEN